MYSKKVRECLTLSGQIGNMIECVEFPLIFWSAVLMLSPISDCCFKHDYGLSRRFTAEKKRKELILLIRLWEKPQR
jgi:hypothetical protein